jgi:hypothetical protein
VRSNGEYKHDANIIQISLAAINFGLMCVGATQVTRITMYNNSLKKQGVTETIKDETKAEGKAVEDLAKDTVAAAKKAVNA